jgi:membrane-associated protease RseP (regulator of RpoE activity)
MKTRLPLLAAGLLGAAALTLPLAAQPHEGAPPPPKPEQRHEIRVTVDTDDHKAPLEKATFLGVVVEPASPVLASQLKLAEGSGLVVVRVTPDSPAAKAGLVENDVLVKLDDQILIAPHQLAVLVRQHKEGDEVSLSLIRGGERLTLKARLIKREMPKLSVNGMPGLPNSPGLPPFGPEGFRESQTLRKSIMIQDDDEKDVMINHARASADAAHSLRILGAHPGAEVRVIERRTGEAPRAVRISPGNSKMVLNDDTCSLEITYKDGKKTVIAKDPQGKELFNGPANTPEELKSLPALVRAKLEKLNSMEEVDFQPGAGFRVEAPRPMPGEPRSL